MDRLEDRLREALDTAARGAGDLNPLRPRRKRRIRTVRAFQAALALALATGLFAGVGWELRRRSPASPRPAIVTPTDQRLYIIDRAPRGNFTRGELVAVDATASRSEVVAHYPLGSDTDVVLSPDGTRVYSVGYVWLSHIRAPSLFRVLDASTGDVLNEIRLPNWHGTLGRHVTNQIAISPDGSRIYTLVAARPLPGDRRQSEGLKTYDVSTGEMLSHIAQLDGCGGWPTILPTSDSNVIVVCHQSGEARFLQLSSTGDVMVDNRLPLTTGGRFVVDAGYISQAALSPDRATLYAVTAQGMVVVVDVGTQSVTRQVQLSLPPSHLVTVSLMKVTPSGDALVVGVGKYPGHDILHADIVLVVDTSTMRETRTIVTEPFTAFDISTDGLRTFTIGNNRLLRAVSLENGEGTLTLGRVASLPDAIYVAPSYTPR